MKTEQKNEFLTLWRRYFASAELPIAFYYTDQEEVELVPPPSGHECLIAALAKVREGHSLRFNKASVGCGGGKKFTGFSPQIGPNFEYFLSCGIPGKLEGERYKKSPELVKESLGHAPSWTAPHRYIVFKRWDKLDEADHPDVVVFFATPDVLSGLFTLVNFDEAEPNGVFCPFAAGCSSIVMHPYLEKDSGRPRAVLGMFDVSARPHVEKDTLTLAVPFNKFEKMVRNMPESFLITASWDKVKKRLPSS
ncbi:MAG: DUF169 domain-containing protein [Acidobacteriota bacterium]|nr:DUF169 domain-containing protein [Acidobacteriota bacterium]